MTDKSIYCPKCQDLMFYWDMGDLLICHNCGEEKIKKREKLEENS